MKALARLSDSGRLSLSIHDEKDFANGINITTYQFIKELLLPVELTSPYADQNSSKFI